MDAFIFFPKCMEYTRRDITKHKIYQKLMKLKLIMYFILKIL